VKRIAAIGCIAFTVAIGPAARGVDNSWSNSADGKWEEASSWLLVQAPDSTQTILITNDSSKTVLIDATTSGSFSNTMTVSNLTVLGLRRRPIRCFSQQWDQRSVADSRFADNC